MTAKSKPRSVPPEWIGFPARLRFAVSVRVRETPGLTQNEIASAAGIESGNFSKMMTGKKTNVVAPTVIQLAKALRVYDSWLLTGQEPSGLGPTTGPQGVDIQVFDGVPPGPASDNVTNSTSKREIERPSNVVRRSQTKSHKR